MHIQQTAQGDSENAGMHEYINKRQIRSRSADNNSELESVDHTLDCILKPRPYQQQCPSNIVECYKLDDSFDNVECCFDIVAGVDGALDSRGRFCRFKSADGMLHMPTL